MFITQLCLTHLHMYINLIQHKLLNELLRNANVAFLFFAVSLSSPSASKLMEFKVSKVPASPGFKDLHVVQPSFVTYESILNPRVPLTSAYYASGRQRACT